MDENLPIDRGVNVQLDAVGSLASGGAKCGQGVLQLDAGSAPVGDNERSRPHCCRLSAFLGSIQPGSFSISCTLATSSGRGNIDSRYAVYFAASIGCPSTV